MFVVALAYSFFLTCAVAFPFYENTNNVWALLVAGSHGFENYRHQADVAHAYNLLISKGVAPKRIITFLYDDIAYDPLNPYPGSIHNDYSDKNYYENLSIDYSREDLTKVNFYKVLQGDPMLQAKGYKVLESGENDNVFIYFSGLGFDDFVIFPDDLLFARQLNSLISMLFRKKKYSKLVFYLESNNSGSMFEDILTTDINAYALTAAGSQEDISSIFCDDIVIPVCLANEFSRNWITDSEQFYLNNRTLKEQFVSVKAHTKSSTVKQFGDLTISELFLSDFQGGDNNISLGGSDIFEAGSYTSKRAHVRGMTRNVKVASSNIRKTFVKRQLNQASRLTELAAETIQLVVDMVSIKPPSPVMLPVPVNEENGCIRTAFKTFSKHCYSRHHNLQLVKQFRKLAELCKRGYLSATIASAIEDSCLKNILT